MPTTPSAQLLTKITKRRARVAITSTRLSTSIGLGYVGLPLAVAFAEAGFAVVGIDVDASKVDTINAGHSHISDFPSYAVDSGDWGSESSAHPLIL